MVITIPSAVAVFAWLATIWHGRPVLRAPFLFAAGFIVLFVIGGVSGVATAAVPFDRQLTDTYFVVAHLHYVLVGINVFPVIAGFYYWLPKMTGRMLNERLGRWNFWTMFLGFNLGFFPMHIAGLLGMPRRIYTYPAGLGWGTVNLVTTIGSYVFAVGVLLFLVNVLWSLLRGPAAGPNPWDAPTLEWATSSPPPPYNFEVLPSVGSRHPLWEGRLPDEGTARSVLDRGPELGDGRETLGVTPLDAEPSEILTMPEDSLYPFLLALSLLVTFYGLLTSIWALAVAGAVLVIAMTIGWLWPGDVPEEA
jgi:heme/copper-type cytochrome/quinol oxidase subunit 1